MKFFNTTALLGGFLFYLAAGPAHADMSECLKLADKDEKNFCMAQYSGSGTYCDKIQIYERRMYCMRKVIDKQRSER